MADDFIAMSDPATTDAQESPKTLRTSPPRALVSETQSTEGSPTRTSKAISSSPPRTSQSKIHSAEEGLFYDASSTPSQSNKPTNSTFGAASPEAGAEQDIAHYSPFAPKQPRFYERENEHQKKRTSPQPTLASGLTSPPEYAVDNEADGIPVSVLVTMIPTHNHSEKLRKDADDLSMNTIELTTNSTFHYLRASLLVAANRAFPRAISVDIELCRWVGMSVGKPKPIFIHEVREDNHRAVLRMLARARAGDFSLGVVPVYAKAPSVFERMKNLVPRSRSAKKRKLDDEENVLHA